MIIPVPGAGQHGLIVDQPHNELPLNAWTDALNVRFRDGKAEKFSGHEQVFGTPLWAPRWLLHAAQGGLSYWLYAGANKVGATDGTSHADITRVAGGDYTVHPSLGWTGTIIEDIPVINSGIDAPQMWNKPGLGTPLQDLTAWPTGMTAGALRGLKRYLIALDVTKAGTRYPTMIKWSHQAPSGNVPQSWNEEDEKGDAGEWVLPAEKGYIVDASPLRDFLVIYKEYETWLMTYVGGVDVFRFNRKFTTIGMLTRRCAAEFFAGKQFVFTGDDCVVHDGQNAESVMSEKVRNLISGKIDPGGVNKCFVSVNYPNFEVWVCVPEIGSTWCNKAFVWNWKRNIWGVRELPQVSFIEAGMINPQSPGEVWDTAVGTWDQQARVWGDRAADPTQQKLLMALPEAGMLYTPDKSEQFATVNMNAWVERRGLGFPLKDQQPPDYTRMKQVNAIWPRISGTAGQVVNVYLGIQKNVDTAPVYSIARPYTIGESEMLDFSDSESSRVHSIKFESSGNMKWALHGYDADVIDRGQF